MSKKYERIHLTDYYMSDLLRRINENYKNYRIVYMNRIKVNRENTFIECVLEKEIES